MGFGIPPEMQSMLRKIERTRMYKTDPGRCLTSRT